MKLTQAILPVAGLGTRFLPWTKVVPKELLPIGNQPIIALLVDEALSVGINNICFVISRGKEAIPQYFFESPKLEQELSSRGKLHMLSDLHRYNHVNFHVVYQDEMKGDGHALLQAYDWIDSPIVAVLFGDDLIAGEKTGLQQLVAAHEKIGNMEAPMIGLQDVPRENVSLYGVIDIESSPHDRLHKIRGLVEKPSPEKAPSTLGIVGKYLIPKSLFQTLHSIEQGSHGGEIRLIDAMIKEIGKRDMYGYVFEGQRLDTGTPEGYREAVKILG